MTIRILVIDDHALVRAGVRAFVFCPRCTPSGPPPAMSFCAVGCFGL